MPSRVRPLIVCAALLGAGIAGCASDRLANTAPAGVRLSGNWALDPAASEDIAQALAHLRAQIAKLARERPAHASGSFSEIARPRRRNRGEQGGEAGEDSGSETSQEGGTGAQIAAGLTGPPGAIVQEFLSNIPGNDLNIAVTAGSLTITSANSSRQYATGVQTAVEFGSVSAEQISGWRGRRYVIDTQPQWGPDLSQSYSVAPDGTLTVTLTLRGKGINATLTRRYRRTQRAPVALLPTSD